MKLIILTFLLTFSMLAGAQVLDDFSDGDFTTNPSWSGTTSNYIVNSNMQLQLNASAAGNSYLSLANQLTNLNNVEWRFNLYQNFAGSASNLTRFYLMSDTPDLPNTQNGYFLLFGEAGSNDAIKLFKVTNGTTATNPLLTGTVGGVANAFRLNIKVQYTGTEWILLKDTLAGTNYVQEATSIDVATRQAYSGMYNLYTASNVTRVYLDDVYIGGIPIDTQAPSFSNVTIIDNQTIEVKFSEAVSTSILSQTISVNPSLTINQILSTSSPDIIRIHFSGSFVNGQIYSVTIPSVEDLVGNSNSITFDFRQIVAETPVAGDVIISEVMADPTPTAGLPEYDFIEIYNRSSKYFNLQGWKIGDLVGFGTINSTSWLAPGEYRVLTSANGASQLPNSISVTSFPAYNNSDEDVVLVSDAGLELDRIHYTTTWYRDNAKKDGGYTLERINLTTICSGAYNWIASNAAIGGTPGQVNSVNNPNPDSVGPIIDTVLIVDENNLTVKFNEPLSTINGAISNFVLTPASGNVTATLNALNQQEVLINLSQSLLPNSNYQLAAIDIQDCEGNLNTSTKNFTYRVSEQVLEGDVIITEVMADPTPAVGLPEYDFVEIYNRSSKYFNLQGWKIGDNAGFGTINSQVWLAPGEYKVLCSATSAGFLPNSVAVASFPSLNNSDEDVVLYSASNLVLDKIHYTTDWYKDEAKKDGGYTLERKNLALICSGEFNWAASTDIYGGTPGRVNSIVDSAPDLVSPKIDTVIVTGSQSLVVKVNEPLVSNGQILVEIQSQIVVLTAEINLNNRQQIDVTLNSTLQSNINYSIKISNLEDCQSNIGFDTSIFNWRISEFPSEGDLIITEVMFDPTPVIGLPEVEYVEIYNRSNKYFDLAGWKFGDNAGFGTILTNWFEPGGYRVLVTSTNVGLFPNAVRVTSFPSLGNTSDAVILKSANDVVIDKIFYTNDWYNDESKKEGGYSIERKNLQLICSDITNWAASINELGGTPGEVNSINSIEPDTILPRVVDAIAFSSNHIVVSFSKAIGANWQSIQFNLSPQIVIDSIRRDSSFLSKFHVFLANDLINSSWYDLTIEGAGDCEGNTMIPQTIRVVFPDVPNSGEILFNEILFNPLTGGSDFIELINNSNKVFNLKDLILTNMKSGASNTKQILIDYLLQPNELVVLTPDIQFQKNNYPFSGGNNFIQMAIPSMNSDASTICLKQDSLSILDSLTYSEKWHFKLLDNFKGKSLERINVTSPSTSASSWHTAAESVNFATPGTENSQNTAYLYSGNWNLSSETLSPDNDGFEDVLVITYQMDDLGYVGSVNIYDDRGREVRKLVSNELLGVSGQFVWDGLNEANTKASIGTYVIVFDGYHIESGNTFKNKKVVVVAGDR